ncbi:hypothetical protein Sjap_011422 [Stephania japonica]|uniref:tRNA(Ile)-lysidine synthetase n=1 Tax=Stephania japonica TaxID=461633 RepID=A0AAP0JDD6_9MAGN
MVARAYHHYHHHLHLQIPHRRSRTLSPHSSPNPFSLGCLLHTHNHPTLTNVTPTNRFFSCNSSHDQQNPNRETPTYNQVFSRRMAMAGLNPLHRIALGVSGGPDSVALCVLAAAWKADAGIGRNESDGCIDGLLGIVVDHGLRSESKDEAFCVSDRVSKMGIKCQVAHCDWPGGRPKLGHVQEAAREMRYQIFQNVCMENQIGVLLVAHHADDQSELFILRLSRNSGVIGLAGMAFTSQLFPMSMTYDGEELRNHGILLVRPLLEFSKDDMYKICQGAKQEWVEDPTNKSLLFARNRIRTSLSNISPIIKSELQRIISACQKSRSVIDKACLSLIKQCVTINNHGFAVIDLLELDPLNVQDVCLSKFITLVLQFISQRHRPVRGRTSKLLLDYMRNLPCKTALTAAGCYLCAVPKSKGTKVLVCCSPYSPLLLRKVSSHKNNSKDQNHQLQMAGGEKNLDMATIVEQIILDGKSQTDCFISYASDVPFLEVKSSESILNEGKRRGILSEPTFQYVLSLQKEEAKQFHTKTEDLPEADSCQETRSATTLSELIHPEVLYHFMNRFIVTWKFQMGIAENITIPSNEISFKDALKGTNHNYFCSSCVVGQDNVAVVRHMIDADWLYLANLSTGLSLGHCQEKCMPSSPKVENREKTTSCSDYAKLSAQRALRALKFIPLAARRSLPVLVNSRGLLLSIPSVCFEYCPYLSVSAVLKPRVPLGGGHSSFI